MLGHYFSQNATAYGAFVRKSGLPVIGTSDGAWCEDFVAITSAVVRDGELRLYAEGSSSGHEQIGLFVATEGAGGMAITAHPSNPVLRVDDSGYAKGGVFDPAVVEFEGRWYMYFSATEGDAHEFAEQLAHGADVQEPAGESIGLATSEDGIHFVKHPGGPVMTGRCPFAVVHHDRIYLFHVKVEDGGYRIHLSTSSNGIDFESTGEAPVLTVGGSGAWDSKSVTTPKVYADGDLFWLSYAGDDSGFDDLKGIGLAWSKDLVTWTKSTANPVFRCGQAGAFDSVSVQSPVLVRRGERVLMFYAGSDRTVGQGLHSQVGIAELTEGRPSGRTS